MILFCTPLWSSQSSRARLLRVTAFCSLALSSGTLVGCGQESPPPATPSSSPSWGTVLQNWWQATTDAKKSPGVPPSSSPLKTPSQDEISRLARQHPAWKLADALEENRLATLPFEAITPGTAQGASTLALPDFDVSFSGANGSNATTPLPSSAANLPSDGGATAPILEFGQLNEAARTQQETSLADFLSSVAIRQTDWQRDYRAILQTALGEEVEAAAQRIPTAIALVLPAPDVQLEMTNLRLRLLRNVFTTEEEREKARTRLRELLVQWRAALREQESARSRELQRLRTEEPERMRSEGTARIQQELDLIQRTQQELRTAIAAEHRTRLEEDFGNERARLALTFPLPLDNENSTAGATPQTAPRPATEIEKIIFNRTSSPPRTSNARLPGIGAPSSSPQATRATQIRALRQQAWSDATRQAQMAARLGY